MEVQSPILPLPSRKGWIRAFAAPDFGQQGGVQLFDQARADRQFAHALCSHTIEHVDDPEAFDAELRRVSKNVTYAVPPLWDIGAALNVFEHRWIFLTFRTKHENKLPPYVKLPFARTVQKLLGQTIAA